MYLMLSVTSNTSNVSKPGYYGNTLMLYYTGIEKFASYSLVKHRNLCLTK